MTEKEATKVVELVKSGCEVKIHSPYLDDFARVYQDTQGGETAWMIRSHVWEDAPLSEVPFHKLSFWKKVEPN